MEWGVAINKTRIEWNSSLVLQDFKYQVENYIKPVCNRLWAKEIHDLLFSLIKKSLLKNTVKKGVGIDKGAKKATENKYFI